MDRNGRAGRISMILHRMVKIARASGRYGSLAAIAIRVAVPHEFVGANKLTAGFS